MACRERRVEIEPLVLVVRGTFMPSICKEDRYDEFDDTGRIIWPRWDSCDEKECCDAKPWIGILRRGGFFPAT